MDEFTKQYMFTTHAVAAAGSVTFASSLTYPIDTLKSLLQVAAGSRQQLNFTQVLDRVRAVSGFSGLYTGLSCSMLGRLPGIGTRFGIYELFSAFYKDGREFDYVYVPEALLAGMVAGAAEAVVNTPFELLKLRAQLGFASFKRHSSTNAVQNIKPVISKLLCGYAPNMKSWNHTVSLLSVLPRKNAGMIDALKEYPWMLTGSGRVPLVSDVRTLANVISLEGWSVLRRGLQAGVTRDCIFGGIFFSTWQFFHIAMLDWKASSINPPPRSILEIGLVSPLGTSVAAGFSGSFAAAASHCFDTAKTRSQCIVIPKYIALERKLLKSKVQGSWVERITGISPMDRGVLFRGIWLRMAQSGIASFAIVGSYPWPLTNLFDV